MPAPAAALEIFGLRLFERDRPEEEVIGTPQPYTVDFVVAGGDADIERTLQRASQLWGDREEPASGAAGLIAKARGDYRRLLNALYAQARYGGTISITIDGREAASLLPDAELASPAAVRVAIDPGPLFHFAEAEVVNQAPPATNRRDVVESPAHAGFRPGEPARSGVIIEAGRLAEEAWRHQGYAKAEVIERRVIAAHTTNTIDAELTVEPGRHAVFGPVTVTGTERMDAAFVARQTGIEPGVEYDPDEIQEARDNLSRLDVFRSARIQEAETIGPDGSLPIQVIVQERLPRRFGVGGSYSTVDGLGLDAFWLHRNLFGRAERLRIEGKVAGIGETIDPADLTYRAGVTFTKPGIYTPRTDFVASLIGDREVLDIYTRTGVTAQAGFTHRFTDRITGRLFASGGYAEFEDDFGTRDFVTAGFLGGIAYDSRDNPADATEGVFAELVVEPFYEFNYGNAAARVTAEGRAYYGFDEENRFVVAGRLKLGAIVDPPLEETAPDKLFFAGGGGSVRGYAYRSIGVETPEGTAGGRSLIEGSAELRVRVTPTIGLVGFVDAGYVSENAVPDFSEDLRIGVGAGLRYLTGFGPIRLDVAVPLDPREEDPDVAFYVGIGQAF
ncbi:autotransporter assembly complex family protein [Chelativorans sp. AA-79]|uniref:autotransporter assembly complex protein TamA n=1 Tax=Chelativorans sp. AA-79 TaxID=3028735 RepID=UPI0023F855FB|nr:autotransporter assembly complex family protein [Chelativorans sp. AA-79]WEX11872.1 autotransporter assembly complex protein TamA [Chelativorans sp. AA-79]